MDTIQLPFQFGDIYSIYRKAVKVAVAAECNVEFQFNGATVIVDYDSGLFLSDLNWEKIQEALKVSGIKVNFKGGL